MIKKGGKVLYAAWYINIKNYVIQISLIMRNHYKVKVCNSYPENVSIIYHY